MLEETELTLKLIKLQHELRGKRINFEATRGTAGQFNNLTALLDGGFGFKTKYPVSLEGVVELGTITFRVYDGAFYPYIKVECQHHSQLVSAKNLYKQAVINGSTAITL